MDNATKNAFLEVIEQHLSQNLLDDALQAFKTLNETANLGLQDILTTQAASLSSAKDNFHFKKNITREEFQVAEAKVMEALQLLIRRVKQIDMDTPVPGPASLSPIFNELPNTKLLLLSDPADAPYAQKLEQYLFVLRRNKRLDLFNPHDTLSGNNLMQTIELAAARADYLLLLVSPNLFNDGGKLLDFVERTLANGKMVVPIQLSKTDLDGSMLAGIAGLPPLGRSVSAYPHPDEAFNEIAEGIKRLLPRV